LSRRRSSFSYYAARQRAAAQAARARARAEAQAIRAHQQLLRQQQRALLADNKERIRMFHESQEEEVSSHNHDLAESIAEITGILKSALASPHRLAFETLKAHPDFKAFDPGALGKPEEAPKAADFLPQSLSFFGALMPGA
jgi:hypothetical protein